MSVQAARQQHSDALIEQLLALNDVAGRRRLVAQHPHVAWNDVVRVLTERVWQEVRVDTHRANRLADAAIEVADILADASSLARSLRAKANALYALDHHAEAIQLHERAINYRFWTPVMLADEVKEPDGPPVRVHVLGEKFVAFRDSDGRIGLLDAYCRHRRANLFWGRNEDCGLRCFYHGWKFDVDGNCVDAPNAVESEGLRSV